MQLIEQLGTPGDHALFVQGTIGRLETILSVPEQYNNTHLAILGHPHSLQGGTINNKVVTTLARVYKELGIASLRFNFRGVGLSEGKYDAGLGESEDMLKLCEDIQLTRPDLKFMFAGFSFGSYVTYRAAAQLQHQHLISIAPSVQHYDYAAFEPAPDSWVVVQGEQDEVVDPQMVYNFAERAQPPIKLIRFPDTTHFFHGKLIELRTRLIDFLNTEKHFL